jgi:allantoicase
MTHTVYWFCICIVSILVHVQLVGNKKNVFEVEESLKKEVISHVRITIAPDGGVARLKLWGVPQEE